MREPMHKNRIGGDRDRTSERKIAKSISAKGHGRKSGGCAQKAVELTSGDLHGVSVRLRESRGSLTAVQKSADGIVEAGSRPARLRHSSERRAASNRRAGNDASKA